MRRVLIVLGLSGATLLALAGLYSSQADEPKKNPPADNAVQVAQASRPSRP